MQLPPGHNEPTDYWLSDLPPDTSLSDLVRLAKSRWRIEHDYRELKTGLGLDHFEGRSWIGWHRHVTLATAAQLFLTQLRLTDPKSTRAVLSLYAVLRQLQYQLGTWLGFCPHCHQPVPT